MVRKLFLWMIVGMILAGCAGGMEVPQTGGQTSPGEVTQPAATLSAALATKTASPGNLEATNAVSPGTAETRDATQAPPEATRAATMPVSCPVTEPDMLGPFYTPGAPMRTAVGQGYVLTGVVRSAEGCQPIDGALVEFWMAGPDGIYTDEYRASVIVGADGVYRFESHFPPGYNDRPPHIHIKVTAPGFADLVTQHYPVEGTGQASFDLVLEPD